MLVVHYINVLVYALLCLCLLIQKLLIFLRLRQVREMQHGQEWTKV